MEERRELRAVVTRHHDITNYGLEKRWLGQRGGIFFIRSRNSIGQEALLVVGRWRVERRAVRVRVGGTSRGRMLIVDRIPFILPILNSSSLYEIFLTSNAPSGSLCLML